MQLLFTYLACLVTFLILDGLWLGLISREIYNKWIGHLMTDNILWGVALGFYLLYVIGIVYFAVLPAASLSRAALNGALLGILCYATYDLTNWATLKDWPWEMVMTDIIWGMLITSICAAVGYLVYRAA